MIQYCYLNGNVCTYDILSLIDEWDVEHFMDVPSTFHMIESYVLKSQINDPDTPKYMEELSGEHVDKYYKAMDYEIKIIMRRET